MGGVPSIYSSASMRGQSPYAHLFAMLNDLNSGHFCGMAEMLTPVSTVRSTSYYFLMTTFAI